MRYINRASAKAGLRYRVVDGLSHDAAAYIEGDTIVYNAQTLDDPRAVRKATAHEVCHSLLGTDEHSKLMDIAVDYYGNEGGVSVEHLIAAKKDEKRQYSMLRQAQALYEQGISAQGRQGADGKRYQIIDGTGKNGESQSYVKADRQVISGEDPKQWGQQVKRYINEKIRQNQEVYLMADNGDVLAVTSIPDSWNGDVNGKHQQRNMAQQGWDYRKAYFEDADGRYYEITLLISRNGDINEIYNVGQMRQEKTPHHPWALPSERTALVLPFYLMVK